MEKNIKNVTDVIDLEYLQSIQDGLGRIIGITTVLLDPQGVPVSQPTNLFGFCAVMQSREKSLQMCLKANGGLIAQNKATRKPAVVTCPNSGLRTAAVPIFLGDHFLGSWLIGQIRMDDIDENLIHKTSMKSGIPEEEAQKNISLLPKVSEEEFNNVLEFLVTISKVLTDFVYVNDALDRRNAKLENMTSQLDRSLQAFKNFIDFTDVGAYLMDSQTGEIIMCNSSYKKLSGYSKEENQKCYTLMGNDNFCSFCPKHKLVDQAGNHKEEPYTWEHFNAEHKRWLSITSRAFPWVDGRTVVMNTFTDITDQKQQEEHMAYLAYNDQRLDISNSLKLSKDLGEKDEDPYLICFDIRGLRKINDVYGRDSGDCLLRSIVDWVKEITNETMHLYRIEGGSFALMLDHYSEDQAMDLAIKIQGRFEEPWYVEVQDIKQKMYTGVHVGAVKPVHDHVDISDILNIIERTLSFARDKSAVILFDDEANNSFEKQIQFEIELKACILNDMEGFYLNYQPIVDARTERWIGLEALCRWKNPSQEIVSPIIFIEGAERLGLINVVSDWVMEESIRQAKEWGLDTIDGFKLDINLSPIQLRDRDFLSKTHMFLNKYHYPPDNVSLEITETSEVSFDEATLQLLLEIKNDGISLALDDFGTGFASFSNLNNIPVDYLKIDRSFVVGIEDDQFLQQSVRSMVDLSKAAGLITVVEGVETETQRAIMVDNGIDSIQGYYFSRPLSVEDITACLDKFKS